MFSDGNYLVTHLYTLQACKLVGGNEVVTLELLPQLVPLFLCPPDQRGAYGSSTPPAAPPAASSGPTQPNRSVCPHSHLAWLCSYGERRRAQLSTSGPQVLLQVTAEHDCKPHSRCRPVPAVLGAYAPVHTALPRPTSVWPACKHHCCRHALPPSAQ